MEKLELYYYSEEQRVTLDGINALKALVSAVSWGERHFVLIYVADLLRASSCTADHNESDAYFSSIKIHSAVYESI